MPQIEITQVGSRAERDAFIKFPWRIYAKDPAWVPPLLLERKEFLNREKHPFYEHGDAALFLARSGGEIVGRIMASDDPNYNAIHRSNVGCFGMFESINDQQVANSLFEAATDWHRRLGRDEIMGPIDYSTNYICGLLIDGFQHSADGVNLAQSSVLQRADRRLGIPEGDRPLRLVVCEPFRGRKQVAPAGRPTEKAPGGNGAPWESARYRGRRPEAPRNL